MKGFKLDANGDVQIINGQIQMVDGNELLRQTVEAVLKTNQGEWFLNEDEGIDFLVMFGKAPNLDEIRDNILEGLSQVDETFVIDEFNYSNDGRCLYLSFIARNDNGELVEGSVEYA